MWFFVPMIGFVASLVPTGTVQSESKANPVITTLPDLTEAIAQKFSRLSHRTIRFMLAWAADPQQLERQLLEVNSGSTCKIVIQHGDGRSHMLRAFFDPQDLVYYVETWAHDALPRELKQLAA